MMNKCQHIQFNVIQVRVVDIATRQGTENKISVSTHSRDKHKDYDKDKEKKKGK